MLPTAKPHSPDVEPCLTSQIVRHKYQLVDKSTGVGVLDKAVALMDAIAARPCALADLVRITGVTRPTAHRLALSLEQHGLVSRDDLGRFVPGPHVRTWTTDPDSLTSRAGTVVADLRDATGLSSQVYRRVADTRLCIAAAEPATGLRDTVPVGSVLTLQAGSAAQILVAWLDGEELTRLCEGAAFSAADLATVRRRGWSQSLGQREPGVGSVSVPARDADGRVIAAVSISGPQERLTHPTRRHRELLAMAAARLSAS